MDSKAFLSLASVALGWLLAQGSTVFRDWWQTRKLKDGLFEELCDLDDQLKRVELIHARQLQVFALDGIEATASLPLLNMYFRQYYKDAFPHLNRSQRQSYQLIHSLIEHLNEQEKKLADFVSELGRKRRESPNEEALRIAVQQFGSHVSALYKGVRACQWHISYHRQNPLVPRLDLNGPMHKSYVRFVDGLDQEVATAIETAKAKLSRKDFDGSSKTTSPEGN
jgi:hypothetical protein